MELTLSTKDDSSAGTYLCKVAVGQIFSDYSRPITVTAAGFTYVLKYTFTCNEIAVIDI